MSSASGESARKLDPGQRDRARGALYGQAIGDAMGTSQEFSRPKDRPNFPELCRGPQTGLVGGGPFSLEPGQVTDDTQMAVCLAESLRAQRGFDADDIGRRYVAWCKVAFDLGRQTGAVLRLIERGTPAIEAGLKLWIDLGGRPAANGALMRLVPLPVFFVSDPVALRAAAFADAAITHADPRCRLASAAFAAAVRSAICRASTTPVEVLEAARAELPAAAAVLRQSEAELSVEPDWASLVDAAQGMLLEDLALSERDDPKLDSEEVHLHRSAGYVRVAFRLAFWELQHAPTFEAAVLDVTNRGGDSDTNAAITGALLGSLCGELAIREDWKKTVERACRSRPWLGTTFGDHYHPGRLFSLWDQAPGR